MLNPNIYGCYRSVSRFLMQRNSWHLCIVLHTSCLLEPSDDFRALFEETRCFVVLPKDVNSEIMFLADNASIPRIRRNAVQVLEAERNKRITVMNQSLRDLYDPAVIQKTLSPQTNSPVIFAFYSAGEAEEFAFGVQEDPQAVENCYLMYFDPWYIHRVGGRQKMFAEPIALKHFFSIRREFPLEPTRGGEAPHVFRVLQYYDDQLNADEGSDRNIIRREIEGQRLRVIPVADYFNQREQLSKKKQETIVLQGKELDLFRGTGAEANLYKWTSSKNNVYAVKIYKQRFQTQRAMDKKKQKLRLLATYEPLFRDRVAMPLALLYDENNELIGFIMEFFSAEKDGFSLSRFDKWGNAGNLVDYFEVLASDPTMGASAWDILIPFTALFLEMRMLDLEITDLNHNNILATVNSRARSTVYLIDADSLETKEHSNGLHMPQFSHKNLMDSLRERTWFRDRKYTDFSFSVFLASCICCDCDIAFDPSLPISNDKNPWEKRQYNPPEFPDCSSVQQTALRKQFTFQHDYSVGDWIELFHDSFFW